MPNTGRPSRDCHACRRRRIKCDLARPDCNRCLRHGKSCPGYRDELNMRFRIESVSSFPANMKRDRRKTRNQEGHSPALVERLPLRDADCARPFTDLVEPTDGLLHAPLLHPLPELWNDHVIPLVLNKFSIDLADDAEANSMFNTVPRVISKAEQGSAVYQVCNAIGRAYLASTTWSPNAIVERARAYGAALVAVNSALEDPLQCKSDSTLLAVWLFVVYEFLTNRQLTSAVGFKAGERHCRGLATLIRQRDPEQFARQDGRNLVWFVCHCTQAKALIAGRESPEEVLTWIHELYRQCGPSESLLIRASIFAYYCTRLCSRIQELVNAGDLNQLLSSSPSILRDMDDVDQIMPPFSEDKSTADHVIQPSLAPYTTLERMGLHSVGVKAYQGNFRMHLSSNVLNFLLHASRAPGCTPQQKTLFARIQDRCIQEFRAVAKSVLFMLGMTESIGFPARLGQQKGLTANGSLYRGLGWGDAIMVYGSLRRIAMCHISLDWQRDAANTLLGLMKEQLGIL